MPSRSKPITLLLLFSGMALFGSATPLSKIVVEAFPVFTASLLRATLGALVLLPFVVGQLDRVREIRRGDWVKLAAIALIGTFGFTVMLLYGMRLIPGVVGAIVMSTAPAVTAAASVAFLGDSWNLRKIGAIVLAVAGILLVHAGSAGREDMGSVDGGILLLGMVLVFGAVCCEAAYTLIGKVVSERVTPSLTAFLASALCIPAFAVPAFMLELVNMEIGGITPGNWAAVLFWGGATLGLGSVVWYSGVSRAKGSVAAGFMGVMPISALVLSYVLLGEPVLWQHLVGFGLVFAGLGLVSWEHMR